MYSFRSCDYCIKASLTMCISCRGYCVRLEYTCDIMHTEIDEDLAMSLTNLRSLPPKVSFALPEQLAGSIDDGFQSNAQLILEARSKYFVDVTSSIERTYAQLGWQPTLLAFRPTSFHQALESSYYDISITTKLSHTPKIQEAGAERFSQPNYSLWSVINSSLLSATHINIWLPTNGYPFFVSQESSVFGRYHDVHVARIYNPGFVASPTIDPSYFNTNESFWKPNIVGHWSNVEQDPLSRLTRSKRKAVLYDLYQSQTL